jgi:hypothetical protein
MRINLTFALAATAGVILAAVSVSAHHSFATEYDRSKAVTLTGSVTRVEWINPHARIHIDVKDEKGNVANWEIELGSPAGLLRLGWTRNSLKIDEVVVVNGYLAKDGSNLANSTSVTVNGRKMFAGSSSDTQNGDPAPTANPSPTANP